MGELKEKELKMKNIEDKLDEILSVLRDIRRILVTIANQDAAIMEDVRFIRFNLKKVSR